MAANATDLLREWQDLSRQRANWDTAWQEIADYIIPHKGNITTHRAEGQRQTDKLFDSTAIHAHQLLAASLHGTLTPSTQPWLSLRMRDEALNDVKAVRDWLESCSRRMYLALRQSNFNTSVHEMYVDLTTFATGVLFTDEKAPPRSGGFGGFVFRTIPAGEYVLAEDHEGRVDTMFRSFTLTGKAAVAKWKDAVGEVVAQKAAAKPYEKLAFLQAIRPRAARDVSRRDGRNMPWASVYLYPDTKKIIEEGGFHECPVVAPRWAKTSGETYGRGPSHTAIPDVRSLNATKEFILKAAPLSMIPPSLEKDDSEIGILDRTPGGRNVAKGSGPLNEQLMLLDTRMRVDVSQMVLSELRQAIRQIYFTDQLQLPEGPQMTATEVQVRYELLHRLLGPTLGRMEAEFLNPFVARCFALMWRARAFAEVPAELRAAQEAGDVDLDVEYEGPLARAQRTIEIQAQDRVFAFVAAVEANHPQIADVFDFDQMARDRAEITGLSSKSVRSAEQVAEIRQQRADAQALAEQLAQAESVTKSAQQAAPMVRELNAAALAGGNGRAA